MCSPSSQRHYKGRGVGWERTINLELPWLIGTDQRVTPCRKAITLERNRLFRWQPASQIETTRWRLNRGEESISYQPTHSPSPTPYIYTHSFSLYLCLPLLFLSIIILMNKVFLFWSYIFAPYQPVRRIFLHQWLIWGTPLSNGWTDGWMDGCSKDVGVG